MTSPIRRSSFPDLVTRFLIYFSLLTMKLFDSASDVWFERMSEGYLIKSIPRNTTLIITVVLGN